MALVTKISNILCPEVRRVETSITGEKDNRSTRKAKESLKRGSQVVYR